MTNGKKFNKPSANPKILVAPLAWGLGHATRCIPIINELITQKCEVFIAAEGSIFYLLKQEFPDLTFLPLMGYRMKYSRRKYLLPLKIMIQIPKMLFTIYRENEWLKKIVKEYKIDAVISDNRFGMYHSKIPSVYITHQLLIKTGNAFTGSIAKKIHYHFIKKYKECWVPDYAQGDPDGEVNGLAGELSHPKKLPESVKYIGCLSRFELMNSETKYNLLVSISGPEPQRTIFEEQILSELKFFTGNVLFIRGLPEKSSELKYENPMVEIKNHLSAKQLNEAILQSEIIISRCGYTTVMDLVKLQKKAVLIPTPGQTEQEYLAGYLMEKKIFYTIRQKDFVLENALKQVNAFPFVIPEFNMDQHKRIIHQFVQSL